MNTPFPEHDEATARAVVTTLCALLDLFGLIGEDSIFEHEAMHILFRLSEAERTAVQAFATTCQKALDRYLTLEQVAKMFAARPKDIRKLARRGELQPAYRNGKIYFSPEAINAYVATHTFRGARRAAPTKPAL